jgi:uncharacterized protein
MNHSMSLCFSLILLLVSCAAHVEKDYPIQPVPFTQVHVHDAFWAPRITTNTDVTIPHAFKQCIETGRVDNFAIAGGLKKGEHKGSFPFDDTDIYKTLEGAAYTLAVRPDAKRETFLDSLITLIAAAQEDDGYLYTARTNHAEHLKNWYGEKRWIKEQGSHELYNAGHLYEAAAAHYQATGKRNLLDIALKNADLVRASFGPGKMQIPPGHQVIEMGLVKLYRITGEQKYLDLAKYFLDIRGRSLDGRALWGEYNQDHKPLKEQDEAVGHAVRAGYLYAGMADVAALTGDKNMLHAIDRLWDNVVSKKLYLTGGIGATGNGEAFGKNYELPNMSAYNETCASIANVYWNHRLFLLHGDARYLDVLERTLYNALLAGVALDGMHFFYPNPLESVGQHSRSEWFGCACCPGNVARFMASVPGYVYAVNMDNIFVNLYMSSTADFQLEQKHVHISQETTYPWEGRVVFKINPDQTGQKFTLHLRIPGWAQGQPIASDLYHYVDATSARIGLRVNGESQSIKIQKGFAVVRRAWHSGDTVELEMAMPVRRVLAHDSVAADRDRVALERGPLVYCVEWPDVRDNHVRNLLLPDDADLATDFQKDMLSGVQVLRGQALAFYLNRERQSEKKPQPFTAIPYYAWAHRGRGEMTVWLARAEQAVHAVGQPTLASKSKVTASSGANPEAVHDLLEPANSNDHDVPFWHFWPHKGTEEWIEYEFAQPEEVSTVEVYWFDDTGVGECRVPKSWKIQYWEDDKWKPVWTTDAYAVNPDKFNSVVFETVRTRKLRLLIQSQPQLAGGIHEWRIQ